MSHDQKTFIIIFSLLLLTWLLLSPPVASGIMQETTHTLQVERAVQTADGYRFTLSLAQPVFQEVEGAGGLQIAMLPGGGMRLEPGEPAVPMIGRLFRLPPTGGVEIEVLDAEYETFTDLAYAANAGELDEVAYGALDPARDAWLPGDLALVGEPAVFHDFRVASLVTQPVQVNPARGEVRVCSRMEVAVRFTDDPAPNPLPAQPTRISKTFLPFYRDFLDWDGSELDEYLFYRGAVQVVMRDDDALMEYMEDWFEWKRQKGWTLELLTDSDVQWTYTQIRAELQDRYEEEPFDFVVIIGDDTGLWPTPPGSGQQYGAGDQPYTTLAGDDNLSDVHIGRLSIATTMDGTVIINKTVNYEQTPYTEEGEDWFETGLLHVSDTHNMPNKQTMYRQVRSWMLADGYTVVDTLFTPNHSEAINLIEEGVTIYSEQGYMGTGLQSSQINNLQNENQLLMQLGYNCYTGNWSQSEAVIETWLRANQQNVPTGAIGAIGTGTAMENQACLQTMNAGAAYSLFKRHDPYMGATHTSGKLALYATFHPYGNGDYYTEHAQWTNLMGDPTVWLWTGRPVPMTAEYDDAIDLGEHFLTVAVEDSAGPVADAWVTLYKVDDNEDVVVTAETDAFGVTRLDLAHEYAGEALLTITARNHHPLQETVIIDDAFARVGYTEITVIDDGSQDTEGDSDGIPDAGETIGLQFTLHNFGDSEETGIELTASSTDPWIDEVSGTITIATLAPNAESTPGELLLVEINPQTRNRWLGQLDLRIETDDGVYTDTTRLTISAPDVVLEAVDDTLSGDGMIQATMRLINRGDHDLAAGWLYTRSLTNALFAIDSVATPILAPGQADTVQCNVSMTEHLIVGEPGLISGRLTTESGFSDTTTCRFILGQATVYDPSGPDGYGYFAFDEGDNEYTEYVPTYDWVEICPDADEPDFEGTELDLNDFAQGDEDDALVELPFPIQLYGETFSEATITSNGVLAFGDQRGWPHSQNNALPNAMAPASAVAVYWDDLTMDNSQILTYYDAEGGRFIVEWYAMTDPATTFEVIFYDTQVQPTPLGDNDILMQYADVHHENDHGYSSVGFWTTGIQNADQDVGLTYAHVNRYAPNAAPIENGSAILFTTRPSRSFTALSGTVLDVEDDSPVAGAIVSTLSGYSVATSDDGGFLMEDLEIGDVQLSIEMECYSPLDTTFTLFFSDTMDVLLYLASPQFELSATELADTLSQGDSTSFDLILTNDGAGPLTWSIALEATENLYAGKRSARFTSELDEMFDRVHAFELDPVELRYRGVAWHEGSFWISGSNNYDETGPNKLYRYSAAGDHLQTLDQPVDEDHRTAQGFHGLDWENGYLYGADNGVLYEMTLGEDEFSIATSFDIPANPARYLVADAARELFWVGDYGTDIHGIDREGTLHYEMGRGDYLFRGGDMLPGRGSRDVGLLSFDMADNSATIVAVAPEDEDMRELGSTVLPDIIPPIGSSIYLAANPARWCYAVILPYGEADSLVVWELELFTEWVGVSPQQGVLEPGESSPLDVRFFADQASPGSYRLDLAFEHDACTDNPDRVSLEMVIPGLDAPNPTGEQPLEWALDAVWPNPFNPSVQIRYGLKEATTVTLRVFDILGREVAVMAENPQVAGWHTVTFTADNLASGMYFLRLDAGPLHETRKLILLK